MNGPTEELRQVVVVQSMNLNELPDLFAEQQLLQTFGMIRSEINRDLEQQEDLGDDRDAAYDQLGAIEAWMSVISTAVARMYAPTSPWHRRVAGWAKEVAKTLRWLTDLLLAPLQAVKAALGATSCGISVGFPWGVSVDLSW